MGKFLKVFIVVVALISLTLFLLGLTKKPEPFPEGSQSAVMLAPGPFTVASYDETFIDEDRPTRSNGDHPGAPDRKLVGAVWYPEGSSESPYPLVVYSHGFLSSYKDGAYLVRQLASLGYVVVAVNYPLTSGSAEGGPNLRDVINQPGDVSFLIDTLLEQSNDPEHLLAGKVDSERIGVTGISLGGLTTALAAFHPEAGDPRIKAALSIAGPNSQFTEVFFSNRQVPYLVLAADTDALIPYRENALPLLRVPGVELVTIERASHTAFADSTGVFRWMNNPDSIACYLVLKNLGEDLKVEMLGTPEQGINYHAEHNPCQQQPLPKTINPLRQQMITSVVVSSFFQSHFASDDKKRSEAQIFLSEALTKEIEGVNYAIGK